MLYKHAQASIYKMLCIQEAPLSPSQIRMLAREFTYADSRGPYLYEDPALEEGRAYNTPVILTSPYASPCAMITTCVGDSSYADR